MTSDADKKDKQPNDNLRLNIEIPVSREKVTNFFDAVKDAISLFDEMLTDYIHKE